MHDIFCPQCRLSQPSHHLYCVRCGAGLPSHLLAEGERAKAIRYFPGIKVGEDDPEGAFLRVTCYLKEQVFRSDEGTVKIPGRHVRFSFWVGNEARCVMSIPESEAKDLAAFVTDELGRSDQELAARQESTPPIR
ncbi:MAG: hypothetical protein M3252_08820 [Actinomycetota bacterium]|nr:hypothetical protein [Actinomycetota bacterium]